MNGQQIEINGERATKLFTRVNDAWATAANAGGFKTKAAMKDCTSDLNRAYDYIRDIVNGVTEYKADIPFDLHHFREKHHVELTQLQNASNAVVLHNASRQIGMLECLLADVKAVGVLVRDITPADEKPVQVKNGRLVPYSEIKPVRADVKSCMIEADEALFPLYLSWHEAANERLRYPRAAADVLRDAKNAFRDECAMRDYKVAKKLVELTGGVELKSVDFIRDGGASFTGKYVVRSKCDAKFTFRISIITAGGYNIQCFHHRVLIK